MYLWGWPGVLRGFGQEWLNFESEYRDSVLIMFRGLLRPGSSILDYM